MLFKFEIFAIALVAFVFLFGVVSIVFAIDCEDWGTGNWNRDPSCDETLEYTDPGGSGLDVCEYRKATLCIRSNTN